jgi:signal transduction histidine kinase
MLSETWSPDRVRDVLCKHELFQPMSEPDLGAIIAGSAISVFDPDEVLVNEDAPSDTVCVILDGEVEILRKVGSDELPIATRHAGETIGETGVLTDARRNATVVARGRTTVLDIPGAMFLDALARTPQAGLHLLRNVVTNLRDAERELVSQQKLAALGTLAAGLAHELNNPAAAMDRSARQLEGRVPVLADQTMRLGRLGLDDAAYETLVRERNALAPPSDDLVGLDPVDRADREEALQAVLADVGLERPWTIAPTLVEAGWGFEDLERLRAEYGEHAGPVIEWLASSAQVSRLLARLVVSGHAISEIVTAVKAYTRLDEAPVQVVDVHEGIEQSLTLLGHKLRSVKVTRDFADDVPRITAYGSELNQVWTNLFDNAADAMEGAGSLTVATRADDDGVRVDVTDTGPGMPDDAREHAFEPFFTTKPPGVGTGLGLSIAFSIVRKHHGTVQVASGPAGTRFTVRLPADGPGAP